MMRLINTQFINRIEPVNTDGWYGFHDPRRGFATVNADKMDLFQLKELMQHKSLETTRIYVQMASRLRQPIDQIEVPAVLMAKSKQNA